MFVFRKSIILKLFRRVIAMLDVKDKINVILFFSKNLLINKLQHKQSFKDVISHSE